MKKLITIILTITISLPIFSCVNCFANAETTEEKPSIYSDEDLLVELNYGLALSVDHSCATWYSSRESEKDYIERISSSESTKKCINDVLDYYGAEFEKYDKKEVGNYVIQKMTERFNRYFSNCGECFKSVHKAFPERFVKVFNEKYDTNI